MVVSVASGCELALAVASTCTRSVTCARRCTPRSTRAAGTWWWTCPASSCVDATGLGVLVGADRRAKLAGRRVVLRDAAPRLLRILRVTRLNRVLTMESRGRGLARGYRPVDSAASRATAGGSSVRDRALGHADLRGALLGRPSPTRSTGATSRRARPGSRWPSTSRPRPATTPTTSSRAARSARWASRSAMSGDMRALFDGHPARRDEHLDDHQRHRDVAARALRGGGRGTGSPDDSAPSCWRAPRRTTSSRSTCPAAPTRSRRLRRCGSRPT